MGGQTTTWIFDWGEGPIHQHAGPSSISDFVKRKSTEMPAPGSSSFGIGAQGHAPYAPASWYAPARRSAKPATWRNMASHHHLVGWCNNHLEKYEFVNGKDDIPYMKWKINMFETTNQPFFEYLWVYVGGWHRQVYGMVCTDFLTEWTSLKLWIGRVLLFGHWNTRRAMSLADTVRVERCPITFGQS